MGYETTTSRLYECLVAETRGIVALPTVLGSSDVFANALKRVTIDPSKLSPGAIQAIEDMFANKIQLQIESSGSIMRSDVAHPRASLIQLTLRKGVYSSSKFKNDGNALFGFESVEFWLSVLKTHLRKESETTSLIYIVGTHLDHVDSSPEAQKFRQQKISSLVRKLNISIPVRSFEISLQSIGTALLPGVVDFKRTVLSDITQLSHMGNIVPSTYVAVEKTILDLRATTKCLFFFRHDANLSRSHHASVSVEGTIASLASIIH